MSLLPKDLDSTAGHILQKYVKDFAYDGAPIEKLRGDPQFFESKTAVRQTWKGKGMLGRFSTAFSLTSSQLLQMMFCVGPLQPPHCTMLCLFLGLVPHDLPPEKLTEQKTFLRIAFNDNLPPKVPDVDGFIHFCDALLRSVVLNVGVKVDY
jgi:hypothetical protein